MLGAQDYVVHYMNRFGCNVVNSPINYIGITIHFNKLRNDDWKKVEEHFERKKLSRW